MIQPTDAQILETLGLDQTEFNTLIKFNPSVLETKVAPGSKVFYRPKYIPPPPVPTPKLGWATISVNWGQYATPEYPSGVYTYDTVVNISEIYIYSTTDTSYDDSVFYYVGNPATRKPVNFGYAVASDGGPINWDTDRIEIRRANYDTTQEFVDIIPVVTKDSPVLDSSRSQVPNEVETYETADILPLFIPIDENDGWYNRVQQGAMVYIVLLRNDVDLGYLTLKSNMTGENSWYNGLNFIRWNAGSPPPYNPGS